MAQESMVLSVLLMCAGSLMIGILPTYQTIGAAAAGRLRLLRECAGPVESGGEYGTAATYMSEIAGKGNRGLYSSFQYVTLIAGSFSRSWLWWCCSRHCPLDELKEMGMAGFSYLSFSLCFSFVFSCFVFLTGA